MKYNIIQKGWTAYKLITYASKMASDKQKQLQTSFGLEAFNLKPYPQPAKFNSWQSAI